MAKQLQACMTCLPIFGHCMDTQQTHWLPLSSTTAAASGNRAPLLDLQEPIRFAVSHYVRYHWDGAQQTYVHKPFVTCANQHIKQASTAVTEAAAVRCKNPIGVSCVYAPSEGRAVATAVHGPNSLDVAVPHLLRLLAVQLLHPFCLFQYASVVIWCWEMYYTYSAIIFGITVLSVAATAWQVREGSSSIGVYCIC